MKDHNQTIGLIGIGLVGAALAERLLAHGYTVLGYDLAPPQCDRLRQAGGRIAANPCAVAEAVDRLILSLPDSTVVRRVIEGPDGILTASRIPSHIIDTTTGDPTETVALAEQLRRCGSFLLDATISGSSNQLRSAEAILMVGGEQGAFDTCRPLLEVLSKRIFHVGPSGSGSRMKLATNLVLGLNRLVLAEGLVFAESLGLDPTTFLEVLRAGPAYSAAIDTKGDRMLRADFTPESRIRQHCKDVSLILQYARDSAQELPLSRVHFDILESAVDAGDGDLDTSAVIREIRRRQRNAASPQEDQP